MTSVQQWLRQSVEMDASDLFISAGRRIALTLDGIITPQGESIISPEEAAGLVGELFAMAGKSMDAYNETGDEDFTVSVPELSRFRVSAYRQRGTMAAVIRVVRFEIPDCKKLHIPETVINIANESRGLVLVTGPAGSGKTTTQACIIDTVNKSRNCHIITLEDPIEYLHKDDKSFISQREVSTDTKSYLSALRACLRQAPNIILLGEMRDHETIKTVMTAAETGHLVISTLHTVGAVNTIDRIIDIFPPAQQQQIRVQLSMTLRMVVSQQLLPSVSGGLIPAFEIMHINSAIRNLIRESKVHQIDGVIQTSSKEGMVGMDTSILSLWQDGVITSETAMGYSMNTEQMLRRLESFRVKPLQTADIG